MNIDLTNNTVAQYKMNDNAANTTVVDAQGFSNGTSLSPTNTIGTTGKINGALQFNGLTGFAGGDYIDSNNDFQETFKKNFSINFWHKMDDGSPANTMYFFGQDDTVSDGISLIWDTGSISCEYNVSTNSVSAISALNIFNDGQETWHMMTVTVEQVNATDVTAKLYNDGIEIATATSTVVMSGCTPTANLTIGTEKVGSTDLNFGGDMDNFCIFDKALTEKEILFLYAGGAGTETLEGILFNNNSNGITNLHRNISHQVPFGDNLVKFYQDVGQDRSLAISFAHNDIIQKDKNVDTQRAIIGGIPLSVSVGYDDNIYSSENNNAEGFYALDVIISSESEDNTDSNTVPSDPQINGIQFGMAKKNSLYFLKTYQISGNPEPNSIATFGGVPMALGLQNELIVRDSGYTTADISRYEELMFFGVPIQVGMVDATNKYFLIISPI
jgi:hypothetical protein